MLPCCCTGGCSLFLEGVLRTRHVQTRSEYKITWKYYISKMQLGLCRASQCSTSMSYTFDTKQKNLSAWCYTVCQYYDAVGSKHLR